MRVAVGTLGCKVNQFETQALERELARRGHTVVPFDAEADAYIVNTCAVTAESERKSRQLLRRVQARRPGALVAACGCYAQTKPEELRALGIDLLGGTDRHRAFLDLLERAAAGDPAARGCLDDPAARRDFERLPAGGQPAGTQAAGTPHTRTRAMLKIEDGCSNGCAYCVIPSARGPARSLPPEEALEEVRRLRAAGYRELVLTGIEISSYGEDLDGGVRLIGLLERLSPEAGEMRLRLGSLEPRTVTPDFCARAAALPNLCPHFHLSLQSGCDATLRRMGRRYDTARYARSCAWLREAFDDPAITTDLMTGFPGETEAEFAETLAFIRACGFARTHVFPYSERPGTRAAAMEQVPKTVREARAGAARRAAEEMRRKYLARCVGKTLDVLFERSDGAESRGYAPNYMEVRVPAMVPRGQVRAARIVSAGADGLRGELTEG